MRKSLGEKRREIAVDQIARIHDLYLAYADGEHVKTFPTTAFGYRKITVERPLRLTFQTSPERITRLAQQKTFTDLAASNKKNPQEHAAEEEGGRKLQGEILAMLATLPATPYNDRLAFQQDLERACRSASLRLPAPVAKAILAALSERDETAAICRDAKGNPEPDPDLRDTENVPLGEDVFAYFEREVKLHVPDAWINESRRDAKDGQVGVVGYEINFNRYYYKYVPSRPLEEIDAEIKALEAEILVMLREVAG